MAMVSVRAYDRVRDGKQQHVDSHSRSAPGGADDRGSIGFGGAASTGRDRGGGSVIFVMRRRSASDPLGTRPQPLEGGGGYGGPSRGSGASPSGRSASPRPSNEPRFDINPDKQARHAPSTQSDSGRSTLHADANALMREFAGRGRVSAGSRPGVGGTRETFDTGDRVIGIYRHLDGLQAPTTRGIIYYSKTGAHIVPSRPNGWVD